MNFVYRHGGTKDGGRGAEGAQAPPDLDRSVNPISNRGLHISWLLNRPKPKFFINRLRLRPPNLLANIFGLSLSFF